MGFHFLTIIGLIICLLCSAQSKASPIDNLVIFGDSLSDSGNLFLATGYPGTPYFNGKMTNGPNYAELLNNQLGLGTLSPSLAGGNNHAWIGARAGMDVPTGTGAFIPGIESQVSQYLGGLQPNADLGSTLHFVFIGGNDVADAIDNGLDLATATGFLMNSAQKVIDSLLAIESTSQSQYFIPDLPDLSFTPLYLGQQSAQDFSFLYNQLMRDMVASQAPQLDIAFFDTNQMIQDLIPLFQNVTEPCLTELGVCQNPDDYMFFDEFHPGSVVHSEFANQSFNAISVSIPSSIWLFAFLGIVFSISRNNKLAAKSL